jgi:hypothetical protein
VISIRNTNLCYSTYLLQIYEIISCNINFGIIKIASTDGGAVVSGLTSSAVDRGFEPRSGQTKTIKLVFVASPLSMHH